MGRSGPLIIKSTWYRLRTTFQSEIVCELFEAQNADFLRIMSLKNICEILAKKCVH